VTTPYPQTPGDRREDHAQAVADAVAAIYAQAELTIIAAVAAYSRKVATGAMVQQVAARRLNQTVAAILATIRPRVEQALTQAAAGTAAAVTQATTDVTAGTESGAVPAVTTRDAAQALDVVLPDSLGSAETTAQKSAAAAFDAAVQAASEADAESAATGEAAGPGNIFRQTADAYQYAVKGAVYDTRGGAPYSSLSLSRIQAAQKALDGLTAHGITGFTDKVGRNWDLASYVEMATRTAVSNMWDDLLTRAAQRSGLDLVCTYTHSTEGSCPLCIPWLGRILSLSGTDTGYPSLADAKAAGFRHPSCRCSWTVLGAGGMADVTNPVPDAEAAEAYKASQRQRALERNVRTAQRRSQSAITPQARTQARRELAEARRVSVEHRSAHRVRMMQVSVRRRESLSAR
jgi:hypothetical protein